MQALIRSKRNELEKIVTERIRRHPPRGKPEERFGFFNHIKTSLPKITKNRYEILFFNKENLCKLIKILENKKMKNNLIKLTKTNSLQLTENKLQQLTEKSNNNNKIENNIVSQSNLSKVPINGIVQLGTEEIENKNSNIDFNKYNNDPNFYKTIYPLLQKICYLRMYFRYTDDITLAERFNKNGKRGFNYVKKYNSNVFNKIIKYFRIIFIRIFSKRYNISPEEINESINEYINITKKLDTDTEGKINNILNQKKIYENTSNNLFNEGKHYKNIEKVLNIINEKNHGYIDYCIILDIKKTKFYRINNIKKKTNIKMGGAENENKRKPFTLPDFETPSSLNLGEAALAIFVLILVLYIFIALGTIIYDIIMMKKNKNNK
jgi:hypothetical protein